MRFEGDGLTEIYGWVERLLCHHQYATQSKQGKGLLRRYVERMMAMSRAQTTRLIARYTATSQVQPSLYRRRRFPSTTRGPTSSCWLPSMRRTRP